MRQHRKLIYLFVIFSFLVLVVVGAGLFIKSNKGEEKVGSFDECVEAGYPVMESYPRQCRTDSDELFIEEIPDDQLNQPVDSGDEENKEYSLCEDLCGDETCQEVVCTTAGCPCAETISSCPQDCAEGE